MINLKISARNQFPGKVTEVKEGAVNGIVVIDIGLPQKMTATISMSSIKELGIKPGASVCAVIKATSVMVAAE